MADSISSQDLPEITGIVALNPDGSAIGTPVGGATSANQTNGTQKTQIVDAGGEAVTVTGGKLDVNATASLAGQSIPATGATEAVTVQIVDGSGNQVASFGGGTQYTEGDTDASITGTAIMFETNTGTNAIGVVNATNPLPVSASIDTTGLATTTTDTNTGTIAGDTTSIDAKIPALGQALAAASTPVVLTAAQITTLTPPAAITGFGTAANQTTIIGHLDGVETLLGTIDADTGTIATEVAGLLTDTELRATPVPVSGTVAVTNAGLTELAAAINVSSQVDVNIAASGATVPVSGTFWQATQPVSLASAPTTTVTATDLDIRPLVNTDVVTAELSAVDNAVLDTIAAKDFATQTTLAAMNAKMVTGTDIGDVTINNSTGASAVNIQDGGNTITVDGTVSANATLSAETTKVIGTVNIASAQTLATVTTVGAVTAITNALPAGTNAIGKLAANSGVDIGDVDVLSIAAGTNLIGDVSLQPRTGNGLTIFRSIDLDESEEEIKATAGNLYGYFAFNAAATTHYIKFYNATAANVTVGSTTPVLTLPIPAGAAANISFAYPISFGTAISAAATTGIADADTGAPAANAVTLNAFYK